MEITLGQELAVPDSGSGLVLTNCVILVNLCHLFVSFFFFFGWWNENVTDRFYIVILDSALKFWNGNCEAYVFICVLYVSICLANIWYYQNKFIKELYLIGLNELKHLYKYSEI